MAEGGTVSGFDALRGGEAEGVEHHENRVEVDSGELLQVVGDLDVQVEGVRQVERRPCRGVVYAGAGAGAARRTVEGVGLIFGAAEDLPQRVSGVVLKPTPNGQSEVEVVIDQRLQVVAISTGDRSVEQGIQAGV